MTRKFVVIANKYIAAYFIKFIKLRISRNLP